MLNIAAELRRLESFTVNQLQGEFAHVTGEPARSFNRAFLIKRIAWARQAAVQGGLSERARAKATELARDRDLRVRPPQAIHDAFAANTSPALRLSPTGPDDPTSPTSAKPVARGLPPVGSVIVKNYRDRRLEVRVLADGFEFGGRHFKSLSALARDITGTNWNGRLFFGLTDR